ncbi:MAG: hypothetical protein K5854_03080 [Prevotella sp.]|nr:hypothetical protein [Prevotella sp.]
MTEQALSDWKVSHVDVYSKFKKDLERQLAQPYHQTILDLGDDKAEPLKSVLSNLAVVTTKEGTDTDMLYSRAVDGSDELAYCPATSPLTMVPSVYQIG